MFTTPVPVSNDTIVPKFPAYFRMTAENKHEINERINSKVENDQWQEIPNRVRTVLTERPEELQLGELIVYYSSEARHADAWMKRYDNMQSQANSAIETIGQRLIDEAEKRNWCSEFDEIIDDVNGSLPGHFQLPTREREYNVSWSETYTITVRRSATVTARSEENACDSASELYSGEADDYEIRDAISCGNYEFSDDNSDFEAWEA